MLPTITLMMSLMVERQTFGLFDCHWFRTHIILTAIRNGSER